jgi:hypothetical protein
MWGKDAARSRSPFLHSTGYRMRPANVHPLGSRHV